MISVTGDVCCDVCQKPLVVGEHPWCPHGFPLTGVKQLGDEIVGGFVQENFGHEPETFYSKSAMARRAKELGLEPFVRHTQSEVGPKIARWV